MPIPKADSAHLPGYEEDVSELNHIRFDPHLIQMPGGEGAALLFQANAYAVGNMVLSLDGEVPSISMFMRAENPDAEYVGMVFPLSPSECRKMSANLLEMAGMRDKFVKERGN